MDKDRLRRRLDSTILNTASVNPMFECPQGVKDSLKLYAEQHCPTGGFLEAVLSNDLREAVRRADSTNIRCLPGIVQHCYWALPAICWGSPAAVKRWLAPRCKALGEYGRCVLEDGHAGNCKQR